MPKKLGKVERDQIILLLATGSSVKATADQLEVSEPTIRNYRHKYASDIAAKKAEMEGKAPPPKTAPETKTGTKYIAPPKTPEQKDETKNTEEDPIEARATNDVIPKGSRVATDEMIDIYKSMIQSGKAIIEDQFRYKSSVENMGIKWTDFLKFAHKIGYDILLSEYIEELRKTQLDESMIRIATLQKLHEGEIADMGEPEDDDMKKMIEVERGGK